MPAALSIIIPVLNEADRIEKNLREIQKYRGMGCEIIVVDGESTDGTPARAKPWADTVITSPRGRARQMNAGAAIASTPTLLFLHADTRLPDTALDDINRALAQSTHWGRFDVRIESSHPTLHLVGWMINLRSRLSGIATGDQAIFVRKSVFDEHGGFAEMALMEDIDLSSRLKKICRPACIRNPVITSGRRWENHGILPTILLMWRLRLEYFFGANPEQLALRYGYAPMSMQIAVFAKAPVAGLAKTRLIPALGAKGAARLHRRMLLDALKRACHANVGEVTLWCAPDDNQRFFRALRKTTGIKTRSQQGSDLGERMALAFDSVSTPMLLMGTDCPSLTPAHIREAALILTGKNDAVFSPTEDGGYGLVGLRSATHHVFENIEWGSNRVMAQTRERLIESGLRWREMPMQWDVDRPEDLKRLEALWQESYF